LDNIYESKIIKMEIYLEHTFERLQEFDKYDLIDIILSNQEKLKELQNKHE